MPDQSLSRKRACRPDRTQQIIRETASERLVHTPTMLNELFGMSRSAARRALAQQRVRADGRVVFGLDVPASEVEGKQITVGARRAQLWVPD